MPICRKGILLHIAHKPGQEERQLGNVGNQHENRCDDNEVGPEEAEDALNLGPSHFDADEEGCADRRGDGADAEVEDHEDTKVDGADAQGLYDGKEDGGKDQAGGRHIHEGADNQEDNVDDQKDHVLISGQSQQAGGYRRWNTGEGHDPGHDGRGGDQEDNDAGHLSGIQKNFGDILNLDGAVNEGENQAVDNSDDRALGCGEDAGDNTADDNDDQHERGDRLKQDLAGFPGGEMLTVAVTELSCGEVDQNHAGETPENAGDVAGHKEGGYRSPTGYQGVGDHDIGWGDQKTGGSSRNVGRGGEVGVITLFFLNGADDRAHGGSGSGAGTGDSPEEHVGDNIGLSQGAGRAAGNQLG